MAARAVPAEAASSTVARAAGRSTSRRTERDRRVGASLTMACALTSRLSLTAASGCAGMPVLSAPLRAEPSYTSGATAAAISLSTAALAPPLRASLSLLSKMSDISAISVF